ncbi:MAG TPA: hypothetical protein VE439_10930 [Anaerolineae bacterium]|jgi:hypothetical protein|nr:hypothetical protein [Anaerolineae bacterium]
MDRRKFRVVLGAESAIQVADRGEAIQMDITTDKDKVACVFRDIVSREFGVDTHIGTEAKVDVEAEDIDIDKAIDRAAEVANGLMTFASFSSAAAILPFEKHLAYEITLGIADREFVQFIYDVGIPGRAKRKLPHDNFRWITDQVLDSEYQSLLGRGMRWYRKGLMETDDLDRFSSLWFGLESLNEPLIDKFSVPRQVEKCKCGRERVIPTVVGVKHLMSKYTEGGGALYKRCRDLRAGLMHGYESLEVIGNEAKILNPDIEKALVKGLLLLLEVPSDEHDKWIKNALIFSTPLYLKAGAILHEPDVGKLEEQGYPHFEAQHVVADATEKNGGEVTYTLKSALEPKFNCRYTAKFLEVYGPKEGYSGEIADMG